jgi:hypothetical protein
MFVLSRYRYLKDNHFWLYNQYYLRVTEGGIYGMTLLVVIIVELRQGNIDWPTIAAICFTGSIKLLYFGLAVWSYFKVRRAKTEYKKHQAQKPQTEDPYVKTLLDSVLIPGWHNLLSTFFIFLITLAFITTPSSLVKLAEASRHDDTILIEQITLSEPWYVQFHFTASAFPPRFYDKKDMVLQNLPPSLFKTSCLPFFFIQFR